MNCTTTQPAEDLKHNGCQVSHFGLSVLGLDAESLQTTKSSSSPHQMLESTRLMCGLQLSIFLSYENVLLSNSFYRCIPPTVMQCYSCLLMTKMKKNMYFFLMIFPPVDIVILWHSFVTTVLQTCN